LPPTDGQVHGDAGSAAVALQVRWVRKWVLIVLGAFAVGLLPWTIYLTFTLPARHVTPHWNFVWAGFDIAMSGAAIWTATALVRRSRHLSIAASVTGAFLLCDAWFDLLTSRTGSELAQSSVTAAVGELPLAALCFWLAWDAEKMCARAQTYLDARRAQRRLRRPSSREP
jgi:hypothetical protein